MPNRDYIEGDKEQGHTHALFFADGAPAQPTQTRPTAPAEPRQRTRRESPRQQIEDDPIPF